MHSLHIKSRESISIYTPQSRPVPFPAHHRTNSSPTRADILLNANNISLPLVPSPIALPSVHPKLKCPLILLLVSRPSAPLRKSFTCCFKSPRFKGTVCDLGSRGGWRWSSGFSEKQRWP